MKTKIKSPSLLLLILTIIIACKNNPNSKTEKFKVWGNCEMCKETIEGSLKKSGIYSADWSTKTKMIQIDFDSTKVSSLQIHQWIANSGYDTELQTASDSAYHHLQECCQYKRK